MSQAVDIVPLGSVTTWLSGGTPNRANAAYWTGSIPWISAATLKRARIWDSDQRITESAVRAGSKLAPQGSTLILVRGMALHKEVRAGLATRPVSFNQDVKALVPKKGLLSEFLTYSLLARRSHILDLVSSAGSGTGVLDTGLLKRLPIWLPDVAEQRSVVDAIDDIDSVVESLERLIAKKHAIKQGMMQQLLTGKTRLPGFVKEWTETTIGDLENRGKLKLYRGKVISKRDIVALPGPYPIYSSSVHNQGLFGTYGRYMFDEEMITWSVDGGGHFFYRPRHKFSVTNVCGYLRVTSKSIDPQFLAYHLQGLHSRLHFDYTLKAHPSVIRGAYHLILPEADEQRAIATALADTESEIAATRGRLDKARAIKQGMMQGLLTGRTRLPVAGSHHD